MIKRKKGPSNGELYTDEDWNDEATLAEASYAFSKVTSSPKKLMYLPEQRLTSAVGCFASPMISGWALMWRLAMYCAGLGRCRI